MLLYFFRSKTTIRNNCFASISDRFASITAVLLLYFKPKNRFASISVVLLLYWSFCFYNFRLFNHFASKRVFWPKKGNRFASIIILLLYWEIVLLLYHAVTHLTHLSNLSLRTTALLQYFQLGNKPQPPLFSNTQKRRTTLWKYWKVWGAKRPFAGVNGRGPEGAEPPKVIVYNDIPRVSYSFKTVT